MNSFIAGVGTRALLLVNRARQWGSYTLYASKASLSFGQRFKSIAIHMERIGIDSLFLCIVTGIFGGAVLALQAYHGFSKLGGTSMIGPVVATTMIRELGPILTGIMVAGRAGSAIAAELASMQVNEQIDALKTLAIDPLKYLVAPRLIAALAMLPLLGFFTMLAGIVGGFCMVEFQLHLNGARYLAALQETTTLYEILVGLFKTAVFGMLIAVIATFQGLHVQGGTQEVARATTNTVALSAVLIFVTNFILSAILFRA